MFVALTSKTLAWVVEKIFIVLSLISGNLVSKDNKQIDISECFYGEASAVTFLLENLILPNSWKFGLCCSFSAAPSKAATMSNISNTVLAEIEWDEGLSMPVANAENKQLENEVKLDLVHLTSF